MTDMIEHEYQFRVRYPDTDQMGTVHHSNYARYYETARWELFRKIGIPYRSIEDAGFLLPVTRMNFRFLKVIHYDDLLLVKARLINIRGARIWFAYKLYNDRGELVNEAETELACVCRENWHPCVLPDFLVEAINKDYTHEPSHS
jgi:acyl-CoA thioester hydrolase